MQGIGREKMEKVFKGVLKFLSTALVAVVVLLAVLLAGTRLIGLTPYTVLSGSMEPTYHVGSVIYVKDVDPTELKVGDPLTFRLEGGTDAPPRIIEIVGSGDSLSFRTQGDANKNPDGLSPASAVIGKPLFSIPYLGFVSHFLQRPQGIICVIGCTAAVLLLSYLVEALFSKKDSGSETDEEEKIG